MLNFNDHKLNKKSISVIIIASFILTLINVQIDLTPPWPSEIYFLIPILGLFIISWIFLCARFINKKTIIISAITFLIYMIALENFTYVHPVNMERMATGLILRSDVRPIINEQFTVIDALKSAEYKANEIWEAWSISVIHIILFLLWFIFFVNLSILIGTLFFIIDKQQIIKFKFNLKQHIKESIIMNKRTKIKILFLGANPSSVARLKLDEEIKRIQTNLKLSKERDCIEIKQEWAVTIDTLMQAILDESPSIVHFSGHGQQEGIIIQNEIGEPKIISGEALANLFKLFRDSVRCVVLNSCYSKIHAESIKLHIPYVIGMSSSIPDNTAIFFSTGFYKAICAGKDIPFAFELGKIAIQLEGSSDDNIPVLLY